jgi:Skp family chaperone for outer membrane proteins
MFTNRLSSLIRLVFLVWVSGTLTVSFALQVGIVDDVVVLRSAPLQALVKSSKARLNTREKDLETLMAQFQKLKTEFDKNEMVMDAKTRDQKQKELLGLSKQWQAKMVALEAQHSAIQNQKERYFQDACTKIAKRKKLNILFKTRGAVYADATLDVTAQVVNALPLNSTTHEVMDTQTQIPTA